MHWTNITTIVGESTHIINRIKSLTVPCGSRLMLIFFSSGHCFSCCLLGTDTVCSPETVGFPTDADLLLVWPLLLLLSPRHRHGLFAGDGRLPNWLQLLRPSQLTWIAKREAVRLPSRLQFIDRLGRPGLRNAKLFGFPPGCSFLDREHDLRKILIRQQIHSTKNFW